MPSTLGGNWQWRISDGYVNDWLAGIILENTKLYRRIPKKDKEKTAEDSQTEVSAE